MHVAFLKTLPKGAASLPFPLLHGRAGDSAEARLAQALRKVTVSHQARLGSVPRGGLQEAFIMPPAALGTYCLGQSLAPSCSFKGGASLPSPPGPQPSFTPSFSLSRPWPHPQIRL